MPNYIDNDTTSYGNLPILPKVNATTNSAPANEQVVATEFNALTQGLIDTRTVILRQYSLMSYGADPTGTNDNYAAFQTAVTAIGSNNAVLHIPIGTYKLATNLSLPINIALNFENSSININDGIQLTINGDIIAPGQQIFVSVDDPSVPPVIFNGASGFNIMWFGAVPGAGDSTSAIQNSVNTRANGGLIFVPVGLFTVSSTIVLNNRTSVILAGNSSAMVIGTETPNTAILKWGGSANGTIIQMSQCYGCAIRNLLLDGNSSAGIGLNITATSSPTVYGDFYGFTVQNILGSPGYAIYVGSSTNEEVGDLSFHDFAIYNVVTGIYQTGTQTIAIWFNNFAMYGFTTYGMYFNQGDARVNNVDFEDTETTVANIYISNQADWCTFTNCYHEIYSGTAYYFQSGFRTSFSKLSGVRVLAHNDSDTNVLNFINYQNTANLLLIGCQWVTTNTSGGVVINNNFAIPTGGGIGSVREIATDYFNQSSVTTSGPLTYIREYCASVGVSDAAVSNPRRGTAQLSSGNATITTNAIPISPTDGLDYTFSLTRRPQPLSSLPNTNVGTVANFGYLYVSSVTVNEFVVSSTNNLDNGWFDWKIEF